MSKDSKNINPEDSAPKDIASKIKNLEERRANTKLGGGKERQEVTLEFQGTRSPI